jgi:hypothetical protein
MVIYDASRILLRNGLDIKCCLNNIDPARPRETDQQWRRTEKIKVGEI